MSEKPTALLVRSTQQREHQRNRPQHAFISSSRSAWLQACLHIMHLFAKEFHCCYEKAILFVAGLHFRLMPWKTAFLAGITIVTRSAVCASSDATVSLRRRMPAARLKGVDVSCRVGRPTGFSLGISGVRARTNAECVRRLPRPPVAGSSRKRKEGTRVRRGNAAVTIGVSCVCVRAAMRVLFCHYHIPATACLFQSFAAIVSSLILLL